MAISQTTFAERLARIGDRSYTHYKDPETGMNIPRRAKAPKARKPSKTEGLRHVLSFVLAFAAGALGVMAARYVRLHMFGLPDAAEAGSDTLMIMDVVMGGAAAFVVKQLFRMEGKEFMAFQTVGAALAVTLSHNLVWAEPEIFARVYSPEWVELTKSYTEPMTVFFRGQSIPLTTG